MDAYNLTSELSELPSSPPQSHNAQLLSSSAAMYGNTTSSVQKKRSIPSDSDSDSDNPDNQIYLSHKSNKRRSPLSEQEKLLEILNIIRSNYYWTLSDFLTALHKHQDHAKVCRNYAKFKNFAYDNIFESEKDPLSPTE